MVFSSVTFLTVFLPFTVLLYYIPSLVARTKRSSRPMVKYKNAVLCAASLLFYAWGEPKNIVLMLLSIVFNFVAALHMEKCEELNRSKKPVLVFALIFNIGLLGFFKYSGFAAENISMLTGKAPGFTSPVLPIGISFYTFQILSYVIDVYKKKVPVQKSILDFGLYISMFPQLIAGPIVQYSDIERQLSERTESFEKTAEGIFVFIRGLAKKTVLANAAGAVYESFTADGFSDLSLLGAWCAVIFYAFQIYFDFGGYSDMAKGLGAMFGFSFPDNFRHPYTALSVTDFWRRWHITLGSWFREYVYIPLGGNRCSTGRNIFNLFVVWSLTGLWHGAAWNFVLWGVYYFVLLTLEKYIFRDIIEKIPSVLRRLITFIFVLFGWVLFSCTDMSEIGMCFKAMFNFGSLTDSQSVYLLASNFAMLIIMAVFSTDIFVSDRKNESKVSVFVLRLVSSAVLLAVSIVCLIGDTYNPFLYFRF